MSRDGEDDRPTWVFAAIRGLVAALWTSTVVGRRSYRNYPGSWSAYVANAHDIHHRYKLIVTDEPSSSQSGRVIRRSLRSSRR